jgi:hypothetical protein
MVHFHEIHKEAAEYKIIINNLKKQVLKKKDLVRDLHRRVLRKVSLKLAGKLEWKKVRHVLQRVRRKQMPYCNDLQTMIKLLETNDIVKENYGIMRSLPFYQGTINNNTLIFANLEIIEALPENAQLYVDCTFNVCPFKAKQLMIILAECEGLPRPVIFGILPGKKQSVYENFFHFILNAVLKHGNKRRKVISVMADFERSLRNAIKKIFPHVTLLGCNFHHVQCLRRKARKTAGLASKVLYKSQHHFILKLFMRISLLPIECIDNGLRPRGLIHIKKMTGV